MKRQRTWRAAGVSRPVPANVRDADRDAYASRSPARSGFTLVELMVSVTLAIIVLGLFAAIYRWSTEMYSQQKGNRINDQRSRMLMTVVKGDLQNRTFRDVVVFWPGQTTDTDTGRFVQTERRGYFCISENDPDNNNDDVLFLTVEVPTDGSQRPYTGRATVLRAAGDTTDPAQYLTNNTNQPEFDDGQVGSNLLNNRGSSRAAEVVYFLRNGTLYRRVLLIRDPYSPANANPQPDELTGLYSTNVAPNGSGFFWRDFDYSVYYKHQGADVGPKFHGVSSSLRNDSSVPADVTGFPISLGIPPLRFGYSLNRTPLDLQLRPREYIGTGANREFIGRFLAQETAHEDFLYPGSIHTDGDPHVRADLALNNMGVVNRFFSASNPPKRGEDILMTNVHEFDIKVWDGQRSAFVDLGHNLTGGGDYHRSQHKRDPNLTNAIANDDFSWNRFDTWHPFPTLRNPPYKPGNQAIGHIDEEPLLAVQITIRFLDVATNKMRQLTIQQALRP